MISLVLQLFFLRVFDTKNPIFGFVSSVFGVLDYPLLFNRVDIVDTGNDSTKLVIN